ncbi:MAG: bifunctional phosphopantothenoylcysteine decarboxylase/phosphopantothenate--cysteine ligase CoaBC [Sorangiineae bacterium]|nr:bifunctional phosphopantothenoylcysteine decarboxylase/phosphopantothenate--cysteine ligase CoaBC [Polyangiaceae bacterium]MEB2321625.1 bifunctional phosphopantothenoylcysteine decarboxylase/phosphopantothenate--cysteine ligase CoaBC [Sorangiineae bacterium]
MPIRNDPPIPRPGGRPSPARRPPSGGLPAVRRGRLTGKRVTLCVTGSIAAYKASLVTRLLLREGAEVQAVMTAAAENFIGAATFAGLTGKPVLREMFDDSRGGEEHVALAARSDIVVVVPATADALARFASGRSDDLVTATVLSARCPVLVAPAMHPAMWSHPATLRNAAQLEADGLIEFIGPVDGEVASGEVGIGRMAEPQEIVDAVVSRLGRRDLQNLRVVVTAGPTVEDIDPVRFIGNRSSGKMGFAIAERAAARGAECTLIAGPVALATPWRVNRVDVRSAIAMRGALWQALGPDLGAADVLVMSAAVGDYRPTETHAAKIKRQGSTALRLELVQNPDILSEIGAARHERTPLLIGFAVETGTDEDIAEYARQKLAQKRVDLVVANHAEDAFGRDLNRATLVSAERDESLDELPKHELADRILDWIVGRLARKT